MNSGPYSLGTDGSNDKVGTDGSNDEVGTDGSNDKVGTFTRVKVSQIIAL